MALEKLSANKLMPAAPESGIAHHTKRKRLAKAFKRPLDKTLRSIQLVREKYSMPENEHERMIDIKKRLLDQGFTIKKNELVRAGLMLLAALDDDDLKGVVSTLPSVD